MRPLKDEAPPSDGVLYVFYDFETTQNTRFSDGDATLHVPNLVCLQQFVRDARTWKTLSANVSAAACVSTRFGQTPSTTCSRTCANRAPGSRRS